MGSTIGALLVNKLAGEDAKNIWQFFGVPGNSTITKADDRQKKLHEQKITKKQFTDMKNELRELLAPHETKKGNSNATTTNEKAANNNKMIATSLREEAVKFKMMATKMMATKIVSAAKVILPFGYLY